MNTLITMREGRHRVAVSGALEGPRDAARKRINRYQAPTVQAEINRLEETLTLSTNVVVRAGCLRAIAWLTRIKSDRATAEPSPQMNFDL